MAAAAPRAEDVCALVQAGAGEVLAGVAGQDHPPLRTIEVASVPGELPGGTAPWLWMLDGSAVPRPGALAALCAAARQLDPLPVPVLLTSKVVGAGGTLVVGHAPWYRRGGTEVAMLAAARRLLPIRAACCSSLLVSRDAALRAPAPLPELHRRGAALEWTAQLLRDGHGYAVPGSVAVVVEDAESARGVIGSTPAEDAEAGMAMLLGGGFDARERLWLSLEEAGRARAAITQRRVSPSVLARASAAGAHSALRRRQSPRNPSLIARATVLALATLQRFSIRKRVEDSTTTQASTGFSSRSHELPRSMYNVLRTWW